MNAIILAVAAMLILAVCRVHVVIALFVGALVGGLSAGLGLEATMVAFQDGLGGGAGLALRYALLGAFAMAIASSGLPKLLADAIISRLGSGQTEASARTVTAIRYGLLGALVLMAIFSQNLIPVHIAFIPILIPPLLTVMNKLRLDRRVVACALSFGLVTTYMFVPIGFGEIFMHALLLGNIERAGLDVTGISVMTAMAIPAAGMLAGLLFAVFISYRKPREYADIKILGAEHTEDATPSTYKTTMSIIAVISCFAIQLVFTFSNGEADGLLVGALVGLGIFLVSGAIPWKDSDNIFTEGMRMMALIGFIMIAAHGFAAVMTETGKVEPLVAVVKNSFGDNQAVAAFAMLLVGLLVTMGIGSSFSTLPIIATIYVPLCVTLGFSPMATVAIVGTAGALGDTGSPASDSTLGPTAGLGVDGQHDHIRDTVIPTFLHFNIPLLGAGWIAAMVL